MTGRRIVVLGAAGQLGQQLVAAFDQPSYEVIGLDHDAFDIARLDSPARLREMEPSVVLNAAAWTDVDGCARDPVRAMELNGLAPGRLADAAAMVGATFVHLSTNEVFDGEASAPYSEDAAPNPINPYGVSKLAGERAVSDSAADHLIVRTAWIFGPKGSNFPSKIVAAARRALERDDALRVVSDEYGNPTWSPDLASAIVEAIEWGARGVLNLAGEPPTSRYEWAAEIVRDMTDLRLESISMAEYERPAPVPTRSVLSMARAATLGIRPLNWRLPTRRYAAKLVASSS